MCVLFHPASRLWWCSVFPGVTVSLVQQSYTVIESISFVTVCATLTGQTASGRDVLVTMTTMLGTAQGMYHHDLLHTHWHDDSQSVHYSSPLYYLVSPTASNDYTAVTAQLTFQPTVTLQCRSVPIINDTILENDEVFSVQLITLDQDVNLTLSTATVTIEDNDSEYRTL